MTSVIETNIINRICKTNSIIKKIKKYQSFIFYLKGKKVYFSYYVTIKEHGYWITLINTRKRFKCQDKSDKIFNPIKYEELIKIIKLYKLWYIKISLNLQVKK